MPISIAAPTPLIARLRRVRRLAWLLIALCTLLRFGDAAIGDRPALLSASDKPENSGSLHS